MKLNLTKRSVQLGRVNNRLEKHGDEDVQAWDLPLSGVMLDERELAALLGRSAHDALYTLGANGSPAEPAFPDLEPLKLTTKIENARVEFTLGINEIVVTFGEAKIANIVLTPTTGGMTELTCQVQTVVQDLDPALKDALLRFQRHEVSCEVAQGKAAQRKRKQPELSLGTPPAEPPPRGKRAEPRIAETEPAH